MDKPSDRLFMDTGYVIARFNNRDQHHTAALELADIVAASHELWTTDAVLLEIGAAFSNPDYRSILVRLWDEFHRGHPPYFVAPATGASMVDAVDLFRARNDKTWSLTDCLSFVVMQRESLTDALTPDRHFAQAGFRALMLED